MAPVREIDRKLGSPTLAASLRRPDGGLDVQAAGRAFGTDAVAIGRILDAQALRIGRMEWMRLNVQAWLIDTKSQQILWSHTAPVRVRVFDMSRHRKSLTPAERKQVPLLRLCQGFDALFHQATQAIPLAGSQAMVSHSVIYSVKVQSPRRVISAGDRIEIVAEGTPGGAAWATLGTLGTTATLEESAGEIKGVYRGAYTIRPGDYSNYCRVGVALKVGADQAQRIADTRSAFIVDAIPPLPPTESGYVIRPNGVILNWEPPASPDVAHYLVFRSELTTGGVCLLARPTGISYTDRIGDDRAARLPHHWSYFVKAVDYAGNASSPSAELVLDLPPRGPTTVGGTIQGEVRWTAYGSPYRLALDVDVVPGARLIIEPGTQIEIRPGMEITVRGVVEAIGEANDSICLVGTDASRGFHVAHPTAVLRASYVEISGARRAGIEAADGECYLEQITLHDNRIGLDARGVKRLALGHSTIRRNRCGAVAGANCEIRSSDFTQNDVGLRVVDDGITLEQCLFDNFQRDIEKIGGKPLAADNNAFWTDDPSELFRHLWGNVVCRAIYARRWLSRSDRSVQFDSMTGYLRSGDQFASNYQWKQALRAYEAALLQERNRDVIEKALRMHKQIVAARGPAAAEEEIEFCRSALLAYPYDAKLLHQLADLYSQQGNRRAAHELYTRILKIDPKDELAQKKLAAVLSNP